MLKYIIKPISNFLYFISNRNFFGKPTVIRKWQCDIFGHNWFCLVTHVNREKWCAWCGRNVGKYPKMRTRKKGDYVDYE